MGHEGADELGDFPGAEFDEVVLGDLDEVGPPGYDGSVTCSLVVGMSFVVGVATTGGASF